MNSNAGQLQPGKTFLGGNKEVGIPHFPYQQRGESGADRTHNVLGGGPQTPGPRRPPPAQTKCLTSNPLRKEQNKMTEYDPQEAYRDAVETLSDALREMTSELDCIENALKDLTETLRSKFGDVVDELKKVNQGVAHEVPAGKST